MTPVMTLTTQIPENAMALPPVRARWRLAAMLLVLQGITGCSGIGVGGTSPPPADAPQEDAATRASPVVPGRPARVFVFAAFGKNCQALPAPEIAITASPAKGDVSLVPEQETTIQYSAQGTCIGQRTTGTGVYYTAHPNATGTDRFAVEAKLASGEVASRSFEVRIAQ
jgi:hypothetical protein